MALELMSPAGSYEAIVAAVQAGADAVYFGAGDYNARRNAKNLSQEELPEAIRYCRLRGVKTYITVNTLVTDRELASAKELVLQLNEWGADAIIVQDLGMARIIRALAPEMPLHASTQLSIHNLGGAMAAKRLGFSRVVLARELPLSEIEFISKHAEIETEVFCHGALCMSYSGQCYFSAAVGGRSGNRGLCAQPCRMQYQFFGTQSNYFLSLKDLSYAQHLQELEQAGVKCVKIEGRMKRPEYTALVTSIYKKAIVTGKAPSREEMIKLESVFSRSGFTDGYLTGKKGEDMFGVRSEAERRASRDLYKEAQQIYQKEPEIPRVTVDFIFTARSGESMTLHAKDENGFEYEVKGLPAEQAINKPTSAGEIAEYLQRTGGTVFKPGKVLINIDKNLRIPPAAAAALRRSALEAITAMRRKPPERASGDWQQGVKRLSYSGKPGLILSFLRLEQMTPDILQTKPDLIYLPLAEMVKHIELITGILGRGQELAPAMPRIIWDSEWPDVLTQLRALKRAGVTKVLCTNIGQIEMLRTLGFELRADYSLNIMNSQAMRELKALGAASCTLSFEMNMAQIRDLSQTLESELIAYGRLPLMITENCVIKKRTGNCTCQGTTSSLIDKTGRSFPLLREENCRTCIYNSDKIYLADKIKDLSSSGLRWLRLHFTTENDKECEAVVQSYSGGEAAPPKNLTRGLYYRGVE